ncbi:AMP-binding protein [Nonomuraea sp. NPDC050556]|uniref:AMP-binding protein n=1 Tax=Nonomuraea sp. NPDC050556 TaxID=3364369 RepID=UPI0037A6EC23
MEPTATVTSHVFGRAYERASRPALIDLCGGHVYGYRKLANEVTRAASGLVRRGARRDQVVGVHVSATWALTLAVHTVVAAGGVAAPLDPALPADELAAILTECDARMLITTPDLAETAVSAAERSRVRQVIAFGEAMDTLDFADLLGLDPIALPVLDPGEQAALALGGGLALTHTELVEAMDKLDVSVGLDADDVVLACRPPDPELVTLVGLAVSKGALVVSAHGLARADLPATVADFGVTVLALPGEPLRRL